MKNNRLINGLPEKYKHSISVAEDFVKDLWGVKMPVPIIVKDFTDHSIRHAYSIIDIIISLLKGKNKKFKLIDEERYLLLLSCILHDIGLQCDLSKNKSVKDELINTYPDFKLFFSKYSDDLITNNYPKELQVLIREYHHEITVIWIKQAYNDNKNVLYPAISTIRDDIVADLCKICRYHSKNDISEMDERSFIVRTKLLASLVRIADELDIGRHRIEELPLRGMKLNDISNFYWWLNRCLQLQINETTNVINFEVLLNDSDYENFGEAFKSIIINMLVEKNSNLISALNRLGIAIFMDEGSCSIRHDSILAKLDESVCNFIVDKVTNPPKNNFQGKNLEYINSCAVVFDEDDVAEADINEFKIIFSELTSNSIQVYLVTVKGFSQDSIEKSQSLILFSSQKLKDKYKKKDKNSLEIYEYIKNDKLNKHKGSNPKIYIAELAYNIKSSDDFFTQPFEGVYKDSFEHFRIDRKTRKITSKIKEMYLPVFYKIAGSIISVYDMNTLEYNDIYEKVYRWSFVDTKAELLRLPRSLFVKTSTYNKIRKQEAFFIVGRKGSGKSTVVRTISSLQNEDYKGIITLNADMDLNTTYTKLLDDKYKVDINTIFSMEKTLMLMWELFIFVYSMFIIKIENDNGRLSEVQVELIQDIEKTINNIFTGFATSEKYNSIYYLEENLICNTIYDYSLSNVLLFYDELINKMPNDEKIYITYLSNNANFINLITFLFGENIINHVNGIFKSCTRKILMIMDGFDAQFDRFRSLNDYNKDMQNFERLWLTSLFEKIYVIKEMPADNWIYSKIDVCLTIPQDRFLDFMDYNRDSYKFRNKYVGLYWSGIELAILIRKRLEFITQAKSDIDASPRQMLDEITKTVFDRFPTAIDINIKGHTTTVPLFQYVLRNSFWRPRDILTHYHKLLTVVKHHQQYHKEPENEEVMKEVFKRVIKETSVNIIKDAFIVEYRTVLTNIEEIIKSFYGSNICCSLVEILNKLYRIKFKMYNEESDAYTNYDKFKFLYKIGFLGIIPNEKCSRSYTLSHSNCFVFNEGTMLLNGIESDLFQSCDVIINPVFSTYLCLEFNISSPINIFDWDYLNKMEASMESIGYL